MIALALLLMSATGVVDDPGFQDAVKSYNALDFADAADKFNVVAHRPTLTASDRARVQAWRGLALGQAGDLDRARIAFEEAVAFDSNVALPADGGPTINKLLEDARSERKATAQLKPPPQIPNVPSRADPSSGEFPWLAVSIISAGVVLVGAGAVSGVVASSFADRGHGARFGSDASAAYDNADAAAITADVLYGVGGVSVVAGLVLFAVE